MEIYRNGRGCPRETLPKTAKATKQKQPKQAKTLANMMEIKGNGRECLKGPYHKPPQTLSKNNQNHQNHKKLANLMEINRNGRGCPPRTLPKTTKTTKQQQPKQPQTLAHLMEFNGNGRGCPKGALPQTTKNTKQKQPKTPKPPKTSKSDGNQQKW
jgi:hypothetical protein